MSVAPPPSGVNPQLFQELYAVEFIQVITLSVLVWELIATLPMEIKLYRKGFKITLLMLSLSRYYTLLCVILSVAINLAVGASPKFCQDTRWILPFLSSSVQFVSLPLLFLRTYAIWNKNKAITFILIIIWIGPMIIGTYVATTYHGTPYSIIVGLDVLGGCGYDPTNNWGTGAFIVNMIVDSIVLLLTVGRLLYLNSITSSSIKRLLVRDGIIYYLVVVIVNVINIIFFLAPGLPNLVRPLIAPPATVAPAIMVGRLFFSLQHLFLSENGSLGSDPSYMRGNSQGNNIILGSDATARNLKDGNTFPLHPLKVGYSIEVKSDGSIPTAVEHHPPSFGTVEVLAQDSVSQIKSLGILE